MKLKEGVFLHKTGSEFMGVTQGKAAKAFNGLIRNNETANEIYILLQNETTEEAVVDAMCEKYDAPREVIARDVHGVIEQIRAAGLLDE